MKARTFVLPCIAFGVAVGLACISLAVFGTGTRSIRHTLDLTARWSYLWFWLAYAGGALSTLFGGPFQYLGKHRREFGLAFASAHTIHFFLVLLLYYVSPSPPISTGGAVFFGIGLGFMYLMVVLSFRRIVALLQPWLWPVVMFIGLEYIEYAFLTDFWVNPLHASAKQWMAYVPFALLGLLGTALRAMKGGYKVSRSVPIPMWQR